ncbi:MAG: 4-alpha-glucanotransferase [Clostridia bacterium]|nr:4-alpha-glucanotransferase [Clostridia bacterium]
MKAATYDKGAGILCHISSLPNKYGIGSLGREAYAFADILVDAGVKYWQVLPVVQTTYGDSPYQSACCESGNPYFIDIVKLKNEGLLTASELKSAEMPAGEIDYGLLYERRYDVLRKAYGRFDKTTPDFLEFVASGRFEDYALFMSLKSVYDTTFDNFPEKFKFRDKSALKNFKEEVYDKEFLFWEFLQYEFFLQWKTFKTYVNGLGIKIIGDIPLYVAYDSADVWASPELFRLDGDLNPVGLAGVPPDYFSEDGQLWGNPLYDWDYMKKDGFLWWSRRIENAQKLYDIVRIDHFRGLDRFYAVPTGSTTAKVGEWIKAPGYEMLSAAERRCGSLNVIAEDLGLIDDGVLELLEKTGFARMKVLLFAFDGNPENEYLPEFIGENTVSYTGTHDNDTARGFIEGMDAKTFLRFVKELKAALKKQGILYTVRNNTTSLVRALCLLTLCVKSKISVLPVQDWLALDGSCRMNLPSTASGNWRFRLGALPGKGDRNLLKKLIGESGR